MNHMATERQPNADKVLVTCPACGQRTLVDHCGAPGCNWHTCRNRSCDLVADLKRGRGHCLPLVDGDNGRPARTRWRKAAST